MARVSTGTARRDIIVVGAGIAGCCAAFHLLQSGAAEVTILDARRPGAATTGAGAGFVSHWSAGMFPLGEEGFALQDYGLSFYRMLSEAGVEIGYRQNGTLMMALTAEGRERFVVPVLASPYAPAEMRDLDANQIGRLMDGLIDPARVHSGAFNPHGIQLDTTLALGVLVRKIEALGGRFVEGASVLGIEDGGGRLKVRTADAELPADGVVLAAGAWTNDVLASLSCRVPLLRVVATRLVTATRGLPSRYATVQCRELRLWLRESFGAVMWGTGRHYKPLYRTGDMPLAPGQPQNEALMRSTAEAELQTLGSIFPPLREAEIAAWAQGVPCYTPDSNPIVGRLPGHPAIVVCGGDNESGVTHGPGLGRLCSELLLGDDTFVDTTRFRPDRFDPDAFPDERDIEAAIVGWTARRAPDWEAA